MPRDAVAATIAHLDDLVVGLAALSFEGSHDVDAVAACALSALRARRAIAVLDPDDVPPPRGWEASHAS